MRLAVGVLSNPMGNNLPKLGLKRRYFSILLSNQLTLGSKLCSAPGARVLETELLRLLSQGRGYSAKRMMISP